MSKINPDRFALSPKHNAGSPAPTDPMAAEKDRRFAFSRFAKGSTSPEDEVQEVIEGQPEDSVQVGETTPLSTNDQLSQISDGMAQLFDLMAAIHEENNARDKAFDTVYNELNDYKNDFVYERMKPFFRALLFVFDSVYGYNQEVYAAEEEGVSLHPTSVKANIEHIQEQLMDAFSMVEIEMIQHSEAKFNPRTQRAVEVVPVEADQDNHVIKIVRHGWTLGGNNFRPADVVVGKDGD